MRWPVGGKRLSSAERAEILRVYFEEGKEAADKIADAHGLSPWYAYKLANQSGRLPITRWDAERFPNRAQSCGALSAEVPAHRHDLTGNAAA